MLKLLLPAATFALGYIAGRIAQRMGHSERQRRLARRAALCDAPGLSIRAPRAPQAVRREVANA